MDLADKKAYILQARQKFSARSIGIVGKGANLKRLDKVSASKVEELYERVLELERQNKTKDKQDKKSEAAPPQWALSLQGKIQEMQHSLDILYLKVIELDTKLESLSLGKTKAKQAKPEAKEVLGFRLVQKWVTAGGKRYLKWYGLKQSEGRQVWVYVGEDVGKAEEKIMAWVEKKKIIIDI
jgi:hypothetical protein